MALLRQPDKLMNNINHDNSTVCCYSNRSMPGVFKEPTHIGTEISILQLPELDLGTLY